jgi:hypothetical protein
MLRLQRINIQERKQQYRIIADALLVREELADEKQFW